MQLVRATLKMANATSPLREPWVYGTTTVANNNISHCSPFICSYSIYEKSIKSNPRLFKPAQEHWHSPLKFSTANLPTLKQKAQMNLFVTELTALNYKLCSHRGPTKEDIPTQQSDVITKVRHILCCLGCVPDKQHWLMTFLVGDSFRWVAKHKTHPSHPTTFLNFLHPTWSLKSNYLLRHSRDQAAKLFTIRIITAMDCLAHHSQSRVYHPMLLCRAKKYDSPSSTGRKGWALV